MNRAKTAALVIGGIGVGTVAVGVASVIVWSLIPMTLWTLGCTAVGTQTMNVLRIRDKKLQPEHVMNFYDGKVQPIHQQQKTS